MQPFVSRSQTSLDTLDFIIKSKTRYDAFYKTELNSLLISLGIETLIISGVRTNLCCETTARRGFDKNYDIVFATATENQKMHEATLLNMEYGWAKIVTAIDVIEWLAHIGKT
ncbi:Isochorismatase hydrolase [Rhizophagus irregularis]|uniref:Isochorismatase hydrolase n=1 Tax=Rhizophagus irregularis TaxID=588596 RepID=A0A2N1NZ29_9GLOM|nr:Isochorismatase hydrolase [Rhizophagus irregularis]